MKIYTVFSLCELFAIDIQYYFIFIHLLYIYIFKVNNDNYLKLY